MFKIYTGVDFPTKMSDLTADKIADILTALGKTFLNPKSGMGGTEACAKDPDCAKTMQSLEVIEEEEKVQEAEEAAEELSEPVAVPSNWHFAMVVKFKKQFDLKQLPGRQRLNHSIPYLG